MVARFHFDEIMLERYLRDQLDDQQQSALVEHVETCEVCLQHIDTLSQQGLSWDDVGEMLRDDELSEAVSGADHPESRSPEDDQADLLEPTERQDSLGRFAQYEILDFLGRGGMGYGTRPPMCNQSPRSPLRQQRGRPQTFLSGSEERRSSSPSACGTDSNCQRT